MAEISRLVSSRLSSRLVSSRPVLRDENFRPIKTGRDENGTPDRQLVSVFSDDPPPHIVRTIDRKRRERKQETNSAGILGTRRSSETLGFKHERKQEQNPKHS